MAYRSHCECVELRSLVVAPSPLPRVNITTCFEFSETGTSCCPSCDSRSMKQR